MRMPNRRAVMGEEVAVTEAASEEEIPEIEEVGVVRPEVLVVDWTKMVTGASIKMN